MYYFYLQLSIFFHLLQHSSFFHPFLRHLLYLIFYFTICLFFPSLLCKKSLLFSTHLQYSIYQLFMSALLSSAFASLSSFSFFYILFDLFPFFDHFHLVYEYSAFVVQYLLCNYFNYLSFSLFFNSVIYIYFFNLLIFHHLSSRMPCYDNRLSF